MDVPLKLRSSLCAPFEINLRLAREGAHSEELFEVVKELYSKSRKALKDVQEQRRHRHQSRYSSPDPLEDPVDIIGTPVQELVRFNSSKVQAERSEKIAEMMTFCEGLEDYNVAMFYLEAQQWDVSQAIASYCDCTGSKDLRGHTNYVIKFVLPDKSQFTQEFEGSASLWNMLTAVFEKLPEQRNFNLRLGKSGTVLSEEEMTTLTFSNSPFTTSDKVYVEYV